MWPFAKKECNPEHLPVDGPWSVAEGEHNGNVMIVRSNAGYREFGRLAHYEHQVGIAVPLRGAESTGLPSPEEDAQFGEVEDILCRSFEQEAESLLVGIITTSGMREFVFYTRAPEQVKKRFEMVRSTITSHEIQLMIRLDKNWRAYAQLG